MRCHRAVGVSLLAVSMLLGLGGCGAYTAGGVPVGAGATAGAGGVTAGAGIGVTAVTDKLRVEWSVETPRPDDRRISGYVYNDYGSRALVRLLVEGLDASDASVFQRIEYVLGSVPAFNRTYFDVRRIAPADHYRVRIYAFTFVPDDPF